MCIPFRDGYLVWEGKEIGKEEIRGTEEDINMCIQVPTSIL
jgi:hypothetical protein